jgi:hypothetical protein
MTLDLRDLHLSVPIAGIAAIEPLQRGISSSVIVNM